MPKKNKEKDPTLFTSDMKKDYTLLIPDMATIQFRLLRAVLLRAGFQIEILHNSGKQIIDEGLKYVHNDTCYPALLVIGQMIDALNSGKYDLKKTALMITQTGGGCRASNYIYLLKKALKKAGYGDIPVLPLNFAEIVGAKSREAKPSIPDYMKGVVTLIYGDLIMLLQNQVRPYEINKGDTDALVEEWINKIIERINKNNCYSYYSMKKIFGAITRDFSKIPVKRTPKVKVGVVGEIYVKFSPIGNNNLEEFLASQDCEVMLPGVLGFVLYVLDNSVESYRLYGGSQFVKIFMQTLVKHLTHMERLMLEAVKKEPCFVAPSPFFEMKAMSDGIIGHGCKMGEGWLLTSEMIELCEKGYENIICAQPFGCLPNHVAGKGMIRKIKENQPNANIVPIDYDPGAAKVNQENRIKLMLAVAKETLNGENQQNQP